MVVDPRGRSPLLLRPCRPMQDAYELLLLRGAIIEPIFFLDSFVDFRAARSYCFNKEISSSAHCLFFQ